MRLLSNEEADKLLANLKMRLGSWRQICDTSMSTPAATTWFKRAAPDSALDLYVFAHHVARWIPQGEWKLLQIDNSTNLSSDEAFFLGRLIGIDSKVLNLRDPSSVLFEIAGSDAQSGEELIIFLTYLFLLFRQHCQIVSSGSLNGERVSIQDGFVYFHATDKHALEAAKHQLALYERNPRQLPV